MTDKIKTLILIGMIYVIVLVLSVFLYQNIRIENIILKVLIANVFGTFCIWLSSVFIKNASLYDPYWSVVPPLIILLLMIEFSNFSLLMILYLAGITFWSIRLTLNWAKLWSDFKHQDWRYNNIRSYAPKLYFLTSFLGIMLFPTLIVFIQLIGGIAMIQIEKMPGVISYLGFAIIIIATLIQHISDKQMQKFKSDPLNKGKLINIGLWKYSRHPNYLGEILVWWGIYLFYLDSFGFNYLIISPVLMMFMFLFVSIPMMEKKILKTRPEYKKYQESVSVLIPFKKKNKN
ncbi:conserved hypothetical protein [Alteracholeplasma palmae J233]|uniref:Uncharacterized protein n=1 Tax=Alteracholeplasma palmae (strain ATCC 49389 / J233) TaxID=1318466 RepID=U4KKL0_ALTPJ|nr:DUF1295 domain-containing protein [Alteracholeplasma palmae]CCV64172.1 conserved hypothetical protein [Alteracholeplasma palmae J233]